MKFIQDLRVQFFCYLNRKCYNNRARMDHPLAIVQFLSLEVLRPNTSLIDCCTTNSVYFSIQTNDFLSSYQHLFLLQESLYRIDLSNRSDIIDLLSLSEYNNDLTLYVELFEDKFCMVCNSNQPLNRIAIHLLRIQVFYFQYQRRIPLLPNDHYFIYSSRIFHLRFDPLCQKFLTLADLSYQSLFWLHGLFFNHTHQNKLYSQIPHLQLPN